MLSKGICAFLIFNLSFSLIAKPFEAFSLQLQLDVDYRPHAGSDEGGLWYKVEQLEKETRRSPYRIKDHEINTYLEDIVCHLAGEYCPNIRVYLIDRPHFNASMYPNGMMHVWSGLLLRVENEAQLAAILGHEIGHYLMAHQIQRYRQARDSSALAIFLDIGISALTGVYGIASLGLAASSMAFSRKHEYEADILGLELMSLAGYQPDQASKVWENINSERDADNSKEERSIFWATHPPSQKRSINLIEHLAQLPDNQATATKVGKNEYIRVVKSIYSRIMENHISLQEYQQSEVLLQTHRRLGYPPHLIDFFSGELYRLRGEHGDLELAISAYERAAKSPECVAETHKQLGYMYLKQNEDLDALAQFQKYLERQPDASDKVMIEYYISKLIN